jgi:hypothetical protein
MTGILVHTYFLAGISKVFSVGYLREKGIQTRILFKPRFPQA